MTALEALEALVAKIDEDRRKISAKDNVQYIPLKLFSARLEEGWRLATELRPNDRMAVMWPPARRK
jgi:hypothetical protein